MEEVKKKPVSAPTRPADNPVTGNEIGVQFVSLQNINEAGGICSDPIVGFHIYDNYEEKYDFTSFKSLEELNEALNSDTIVEYISNCFPGKVDKFTLRKFGCMLNGKFIDSTPYNTKFYDIYTMPELASYKDLGCLPAEKNTLVAALFPKKDKSGDSEGYRITLRISEPAKIQYRGTVYSSPSEYPIDTFRPTESGGPISSEIRWITKNVYEVYRESNKEKTCIKSISNDAIPKYEDLFTFLFSNVDMDIC